MAERYFPFDAGAGANVLEVEWAKMGRRWLGTGVISGYLNVLATLADNTGMQVKLPTGAAWIEGTYYENDAQIVLAIAAADPTNPRIDRVVLKVDWTANTIAAIVKTGVAAGSPTAPALTQTFGVTWEFPLAQIAVAAATGSIVAGNVTDQRVFASNTDVNRIATGAANADTSRYIALLFEISTRWTDIAYDANGRVTTITTRVGSGGAVVLTETIAYNGDDTVNTITQVLPGSAPNTVVTTFGYSSGRVATKSRAYS